MAASPCWWRCTLALILFAASIGPPAQVHAALPDSSPPPFAWAQVSREMPQTDRDQHAHPHPHTAESATPHPDLSTERQPQLLQLLAIYSAFIAAASLMGGWIPGRVHVSHLQFQMLLSLVGGLLLGIGVFHLLPHAVHEFGPGGIDRAALWMMGGILLMFLLLRAFHVHHHEPVLIGEPERGEAAPHSQSANPEPSAPPDAGHIHCHHPHHHAGGTSAAAVRWGGLFFGLGVHTLLDGLALGAALQADSAHGVPRLAGLGIMLAITLHKPIDSLSITTLMLNAKCSPQLRWGVNLLYAVLCPLGATAFVLGMGALGDTGHQVVGSSLALSAGVFLCIALSDLLPEMEFHAHHRGWLSAALMLGIALAWGMQYLEPEHLHH